MWRISLLAFVWRLMFCGEGWEHSKSLSPFLSLSISMIWARALCALRPRRTTMRRFCSKFSKSANEASPAAISSVLAARILPLAPRNHGTMFHVIVLARGSPASSFSFKKFFAVSSGLSLDTNPDSTALGPGASRRNKISAPMPPSQGSKFGTALWTFPRTWTPTRSRFNDSTRSVSPFMCSHDSSALCLSCRCSGSPRSFGVVIRSVTFVSALLVAEHRQWLCVIGA